MLCYVDGEEPGNWLAVPCEDTDPVDAAGAC